MPGWQETYPLLACSCAAPHSDPPTSLAWHDCLGRLKGGDLSWGKPGSDYGLRSTAHVCGVQVHARIPTILAAGPLSPRPAL